MSLPGVVRNIALLAVAIALAGAAASSAPADDGLAPTLVPGVLSVGIRPPIGAFQAGAVRGGTIADARGLEVDLALAIGDVLGLTVEFRYVAFEEGFRSAGTKPWDIGLGRLTPAAAGSAHVPYFDVPAGVLLRRGLSLTVESLSDLRWLRLCARASTPGAQLISGAIQPVARPLLVANEVDELGLLRARRCDAAVDDAARLAAARKLTPGAFGALAGRVADADAQYAVALPPGSGLVDPVREAIRRLKLRGEMGRLSRSWLGVDPRRLTALRPGGPTTVTLIGDSVAAAFNWAPASRPLLAHGLDVRFEAISCRRLAALSCGTPAPPSAMQTIATDGRRLGDVVVMDIGYNDSPFAYRHQLDAAMRQLVRAHVRHVVWVTLRERYANYASTNATIRAAALRWPQIAVADWNAHSVGRPWFSSDGIHLNTAGAYAHARFLRGFVAPPAVSSS